MDALWKRCAEALRAEIGEKDYALWVEPLKVAPKTTAGTLTLNAPNQQFVKHVTENYLGQIQSFAKFASRGEAEQVLIQVPSDTPAITEKKLRQQQLNPQFTFDQFFVGESNHMAFETARHVLENLGSSEHNPLFLYGSTGLGKTHLMHALGHEVQAEGKRVLYMTSEQFINQFVSSVRGDNVDAFKKKTRDCDLLLVDDIHMLAKKDKSSLEFLSLFNDLIASGKQLVLAADRYPSSMTDFDERLKSRFSWGLSVGVEPPDFDTRVGILTKKAERVSKQLPTDCAEFIARHVVANVRELEGALNKVVAVARFKDTPIDLPLVQNALKDIISIRQQTASLPNIQKVVSEHFGLNIKELLGKKRTRAIARPRQIAMHIARKLTSLSYPEIGAAFGGRDHSTVMHAVDTIDKMIVDDHQVEQDYQQIMRLLER